MEELSEQEVKALLAEKEELLDKTAVLETRLAGLKEQNQMLQSGLRMAGMDQMPKVVVEMARARMGAGLREDQAIECSLKQYHYDLNSERNGTKPLNSEEAVLEARKQAASEQAAREQVALDASRTARKGK